MDTQLKIIDTGVVANGAPPTTGNINYLNSLAQGTDYNQRIGREIIMDSLWLLWTSFPTTTSAPTGDIHRIILLYDTQPNGSTVNVTDILASANYNSPYNFNYRDRFIIMEDKFFELEANAYTAGALTQGNPAPITDLTERRLDLTSVFNANSAAIPGGIQSGALLLLTISQNAIYSSNFNSRVFFFDP